MLKFFVRLLFRLLFRVEVRNQSGLREFPGRLLIIANHQSFLDGVLLGAFLPMDPMWVVHTTIARKWVVRLLMRGIPHVVVDATNPLAVKTLIHLLEEGRPVMIFPEGRITVTGALMKIYDGPAFIAAKSGAPILPIRIDGALETYLSRMPASYPKRLFPKLTLTLLPLTGIEMPEARTARQRRRLASELMRRMMQRMLFDTEPRRTLFEALVHSIGQNGRGTKIVEDVRQQPESYGHLLKASLALGRLVSKLSDEGEAVGVLMPNVSANAALVFGMFAMRRVPAMLNFTAGVEGLQNACTLAQVKTVLTSRAFVERARLGDTIAQLRDVRILYLEDLRPMFGLRDKLWLIGWALWFPRRVMRKAALDDRAVILFTSGSEGKPKGVVLSHGAIMANVNQVKAVIEFTNKDQFLNALPMFHAFGLTAGTILPLVSGCRLFMYPTPLHYRIIPELIYDRDCTVVFGTPTFLGKYAQFAHPYDFRSLRCAVAGAEKLPEEIRRLWMDKFGVRILEGYGTTECAPVLSVNTPLACRAGTVGELLPGIEYRLRPIAGIERGGELHVSGPNMMLGYLLHDQPGELRPPASEFGEGWYNTGDVVEVDSDGFLIIRDRVKRFAKVAGEMVPLEMVERIAAAASPGVPHAASSYADLKRGEVIVLFTQDPNLRREHLREAEARLGLPEVAIARMVVHLEKIPLLGSGKTDYVKLKGMAEAAGSQQVHQP